MIHKNYHTFKANSNYDLGFLEGQKFSKEAHDAISASKSYNWEERLATGQKTVEITNKYFPQYIQELKGYAKGADVEFLDLWTISIEYDSEIDKEGRCTNIITNGGKLIGHNEDAEGAGEENSFCIIKKTIQDLTTLEIFYYNSLGGSTVGVNSFGYVQSINTLLFTKTKLGIPKNVIARYLLETKNPDEDFEKVMGLPRSSGYNHNVVRKDGKIWNLELTADDGILVKPVSPFVHTNHCLKLKSDFKDDYGTVSRLEVALSGVKDKMTVDELMVLQGDTTRGSGKSIFNERTIGRMIIDFESMIAKIWLLREKELGWVDYPLDFIV